MIYFFPPPFLVVVVPGGHTVQSSGFPVDKTQKMQLYAVSLGYLCASWPVALVSVFVCAEREINGQSISFSLSYNTAQLLLWYPRRLLYIILNYIRIAERFYRDATMAHRRCVSNETFIACRSSYSAQDALFNKGSLSLSFFFPLFFFLEEPSWEGSTLQSFTRTYIIYIKFLIVYHAAYCVRVSYPLNNTFTVCMMVLK